MNDSLWTFLFEIANFVALAAVLAWLFFKPVRKAIADQQAKMQKLESDAAKKLADAERSKQEIESQRQALDGELEKMRVSAREAAQHEAEEILESARARAEQEQAAIKRDALHIEQAQVAKLATAVATTARQTMDRFLQQMDGPEMEKTLLKAACRELQKLPSNQLGPVTVESARALDDEARRQINESLGSAATSADFHVSPELDGGLRISTAHGLIDASTKGLADFAEQSLAAEMHSILREESASE